MNKESVLQDLGSVDAFAEPCFIFSLRSRDKSDLITRYRGTAVRSDDDGWSVSTWQKSMYRYGGMYREVPIALSLKLDKEGKISKLSIARESNGSQGKSCDFACLEAAMREKLMSVPFAEFNKVYKDAATTGCLHVFEILSGASSFFAYLGTLGKAEGSEQELLRIKPNEKGFVAYNEHEILGERATSEITLTHKSKPAFNKQGLPVKLDAELVSKLNGELVAETEIKADDFAACHGALNKLLTKTQHAEKKYFGIKGKMRFSNLPSLVGQCVLTLSHGGMSGKISRAVKLENILIFIQTGEGREGCIGFRKGLNMNQQYLVKGIAAFAALIAATACGLALKFKK